MKRRRSILMLVGAGALLGALIFGLRPRPPLVEGVTVTRGPLSASFTEEGKTRVIDRYLVSAPVAGFAQRIDLKVGDQVETGAPLLRLEPLRASVLDRRSRAEAEARVSAAEAALEAAKEQARAAAADAAFWEGELARIQELAQSGVVARDKLDQTTSDARRADASLRSAHFRVDVARHDLDAARTALRYSAAEPDSRAAEVVTVRAPVSGRLLKRFRESEGVVAAADPLVEIGDSQGLEVVVEALSSDAVQLAPGGRAVLERWGGDDVLEARIRLIEPVAFTKVSALGVEEQRVLVILDIVSPREKWKLLGDAFRVECRFILWEGENVLQGPAGAFFRTEEGWATFVVENGRAVERQVGIGHRGRVAVEIVSGVDEGDILVAHPSDSIPDGARIEVTR
jgi:HlyD family secretion protein